MISDHHLFKLVPSKPESVRAYRYCLAVVSHIVPKKSTILQNHVIYFFYDISKYVL